MAADQRGVAVGGERDAVAEGAFAGSESPSPASSPPMSFSPCWVQVVPERVNTHAAPASRCLSGRRSARCSPVGGERHAVAEVALPFSPAPVSFRPAGSRSSERVNTHAAPTPRCRRARRSARVRLRRRQRDAGAEFAFAALFAAGELCALLGPGRARAREHPRRADAVVVGGPPISAVRLLSADSATLLPNSPRRSRRCR